ncbi:hypothetical protein [Chondromyces apiculatus]|uniref:Uncharacterized protein n=1 Tax=Chondromyces apiculatus DSM 436 TaxID=1192034 RepID=A0A017T7B3_9BACT|nr:hypothetical protein [Chondromyces apiculatus]EYF05138.1 Hypothetical protein CAP_3503 [Chondromyces apiculatus DSM 436]
MTRKLKKSAAQTPTVQPSGGNTQPGDNMPHVEEEHHHHHGGVIKPASTGSSYLNPGSINIRH